MSIMIAFIYNVFVPHDNKNNVRIFLRIEKSKLFKEIYCYRRGLENQGEVTKN